MKPSLTLTLCRFLLVFTASAALASPPSDARPALREAAEKFSTELRRERISGLPTVTQMERLGPLMTAGLRGAIGKARELQAAQMREAPDEKPDWIEGDLFSSSFEGVTSWELGEVFAAPTTDGLVKVRQTYSEAGQSPVKWTDTLVFKNDGKTWLLDDILLGGEWAFKPGASLRDGLPGGGRESADHRSPDGRWLVTFQRDGEDVMRVSIADKGVPAKAQVLFGKDGETCPMPTWVVWNPESNLLALRLGDSPRFTRTLVFRLEGARWLPVGLPVFYAKERATMEKNGFRRSDDLVDAAYWSDERTLVVQFFASYTKEDEGDGFAKLVSVRIDESGKAAVVGAVDAPPQE